MTHHAPNLAFMFHSSLRHRMQTLLRVRQGSLLTTKVWFYIKNRIWERPLLGARRYLNIPTCCSRILKVVLKHEHHRLNQACTVRFQLDNVAHNLALSELTFNLYAENCMHTNILTSPIRSKEDDPAKHAPGAFRHSTLD